MTIEIKNILSLIKRLHPTFVRLIGIFFGVYLMGAHAFFSFYFIHMLLKSIAALFYLDSDVNIARNIKKKIPIRIKYFSYVVLLNTISAIFILSVYVLVIVLFDKFISSQAIDMGFAKFYALTICSTILVPFAGVIKSQGSFFSKALVLRGENLMILFFIVVFVVTDIDRAFLPYAWLSASLIMSLLMIVFGLLYLARLDPDVGSAPMDRMTKKAIWQEIITYSMRRTNSRATFLMAKGAISAILGPFAGLALKAIHFSDDVRRQEYFTKLKRRRLFKHFDNRVPSAVKRSITRGRALSGALVIAALIVAAMIALRGILDDLLLLGLLVLVSKIVSISVRFLVLIFLVPPPKDVPASDENHTYDEDGTSFKAL